MVAALGSLLGATALPAQTPGCPASVPTPVMPAAPTLPPDSAARGSEYWLWTHAFDRPARGVGILETAPGSSGEPPGYDWLPEISLPLYARPAAPEPTVWMHRGWWVSAPSGGRQPRPITYRGMMEVAYEESRLVITTLRADGWIQVHVDIGPIARSATDGLLWTHACLLSLGHTSLEIRRWEEIFRGPHAPPLSFLGEDSHPLRSAPDEDAAVLTRLEPEDEVVILEFRGDWARVRAHIPGVFLTGCLGEAWEGATRAGWIRWRDPAAGTLLWYPTRGC